MRVIYLFESLPHPESFDLFLKHQATFECLHRMWVEKQIDKIAAPGASYPRQFDQDVADALERLRKSYNDSLLRLGKYAEPRSFDHPGR